MKPKIYRNRLITQSLIWGCVIILFLPFAFSSCGGGKTDTVENDNDSITYQIFTADVKTLISDSGVTKYKLEAKEHYVYSDPEALWYFPEGFYVEMFDTLLVPQASVKADTAYFFQDKDLWELIGNVEMVNISGDKFYSNRLYWDRGREKIYNREYTKIEMAGGRVNEANGGFESNQTLTKWSLFHNEGEMPVDTSTPHSHEADSLSNSNVSH